MKYIHICEVCGKILIASPEEAFNMGWDYPPFIGKFGIISPRTCEYCNVQDTLWWDIAINHISPDELSEEKKIVLKRILGEPESIMIK